MLAGLGKWLRAAGHDTAIAAPAEADSRLLARAESEARRLLTCDRRMLAERRLESSASLVLLSSSRPEEAAVELRERLALDWLAAPFSRCLQDNTPLREATREEAAQIPDEAQRRSGPVKACPSCGRVYWPGSHVRRMRRKLM